MYTRLRMKDHPLFINFCREMSFFKTFILFLSLRFWCRNIFLLILRTRNLKIDRLTKIMVVLLVAFFWWLHFAFEWKCLQVTDPIILTHSCHFWFNNEFLENDAITSSTSTFSILTFIGHSCSVVQYKATSQHFKILLVHFNRNFSTMKKSKIIAYLVGHFSCIFASIDYQQSYNISQITIGLSDKVNRKLECDNLNVTVDLFT